MYSYMFNEASLSATRIVVLYVFIEMYDVYCNIGGGYFTYYYGGVKDSDESVNWLYVSSLLRTRS